MHRAGEEDEGDTDDAEDEAMALAGELPLAEAVGGSAFEGAMITAIAVEVIATGGSGMMNFPVMEPPMTEVPAFTATGGSGFHADFGDINVSGATPTVIEPTGDVPPNVSGALVVGAFITALGDISSKLRGTAAAGKILQLPGPPVIKAAIAAGIVVVASTSNIESAFTFLMGQREGRFEQDRPEQRDFDALNNQDMGRDPVFQVERPARGFLVDLSQRFIPPEPEEGGGDTARLP